MRGLVIGLYVGVMFWIVAGLTLYGVFHFLY